MNDAANRNQDRALPPAPGKIIAVHLSYESRAAQRGRRPAAPSYFLKPTSSLATSDDEIARPAGTELLAFEGEIALVIGKRASWVSTAEAWSFVGWVTAGNDWGLYDLRAADKGSNLRNKGRDGYTPVGPDYMDARTLDPAGLRVRTWLDGRLVQDDRSAGMFFSPAQIIADLSQHVTLEPGDIILTGTPAGSSVAQPGNTVEVEVDAPDAPGAPTSGRLVSHVVEGRGNFDEEIGVLPSVDDQQRAAAWGSRAAAGLAAQADQGLTPELRAKLQQIPAATLSQQLRAKGYNNVAIDGPRPIRPGIKIVGTARTLRFVPNREDLFRTHGGGYNAQKQAFDALGEGDVMVIEARGDAGAGTLGDVLALRAQTLGAAGIVTDGAVRDSVAVAELDIPVFNQGAHPAVLGRKHVPWDYGQVIACGGATVCPGDIIVADADGIVVIPPALAEEVADAALAKEEADTWVAKQIALGHPIEGLFPMNDQWRARYEADQNARGGEGA